MITGYMVKVHQDRLLGAPRRAGDKLTLADLATVSQAVLSSNVALGILEPVHDDERGDAVMAAIADLGDKVGALTARVDRLAEIVAKLKPTALKGDA